MKEDGRFVDGCSTLLRHNKGNNSALNRASSAIIHVNFMKSLFALIQKRHSVLKVSMHDALFILVLIKIRSV
jgi:hypothetical protein